MGSFSVACQISGITIGYEKDVVLFPLIEDKGVNFGLKYYKLYCTPIFGKYGDYGQIMDVQENISTKILTNIHGSLENFLQKLDKGVDDGIKYCFVDREVYDFCTKNSTKVDIENVDYESADFIWGMLRFGISSTDTFYGTKLLEDNLPPLYIEYVESYCAESLSNVQREMLKYIDDKEFLQTVYDVDALLWNIKSFSKRLEPVDVLSTPQFPNHKTHHYFLKEFSRIVKKRIKE